MAEQQSIAPIGKMIALGNSELPLKIPEFAHPQYRSRFHQWKKIRDCFEGEDVVKDAGEAYLPSRDAQETIDYSRYKQRAVFVNFIARTIDTLTSAVFKRKEIVRIPKALQKFVDRTTDDGINLRQLTRWILQELCLVSRVGLLLDLPATSSVTTNPYVSRYTTENIISWGSGAVPNWILLREQKGETTNLFAHDYKHSHLLLALDRDGFYCIARPTEAQLNKIAKEDDLWTTGIEYTYPMIYGSKLRTIPFWFIGSLENTSSVPKPMMLDIANLNLAHYRNYADLETGRHYTGFPIYTIFSDDEPSDIDDNGNEAVVKVSPNHIWELGQDDKAEILEFTGAGLTSLENGLAEKEEHLRSMGATLLSSRANAAARSSKNEEATQESRDATLSDVVESISSAITGILKTAAQWSNITDATIMFFLNRHFNVPGIGSRELRVLLDMVGKGISPKDLYVLMKDAGWLPETTTEEEFIRMIDEEIITPRKEEEALARRQARADARVTSAEARLTKVQIEKLDNNDANNSPEPTNPSNLEEGITQ